MPFGRTKRAPERQGFRYRARITSLIDDPVPAKRCRQAITRIQLIDPRGDAQGGLRRGLQRAIMYLIIHYTGLIVVRCPMASPNSWFGPGGGSHG